MKINDNYTKVNVENEIKTEGSVFNFYKKEKQLIQQFQSKSYDLTSEQEKLEEGKIQNIEEVRDQYNRNSENVVDFLIDNIVKVNLSIQQNIIGNFEKLKNN